MAWPKRLLAPAALLLCLAPPAHGAYYSGIWDPAYGQPFDGLGWRGSALFYVPDGCKPTGTADISNAAACDSQAVVDAAQVEFYDLNDPLAPTLAALTFEPTTLLIDTLRFVDGQLTQLDTSLSNLVQPSGDLSAFGVGPTTWFGLQFTLDNPRLGYADCFSPTACQVQGFNDGAQFPPRFVITELHVPEPATLLLVALAAAGAAAASRRRPA